VQEVSKVLIASTYHCVNKKFLTSHFSLKIQYPLPPTIFVQPDYLYELFCVVKKLL